MRLLPPKKEEGIAGEPLLPAEQLEKRNQPSMVFKPSGLMVQLSVYKKVLAKAKPEKTFAKDNSYFQEANPPEIAFLMRSPEVVALRYCQAYGL